MTDLIAVAVVAVPFLVAIAFAALRDGRHTDRAHLVCAVAVAVAPLAVAGISLSQLADPLRGSWYVVDPAGAIFLIVIAMSGALTAAVSPSYLAGERGGFFAADRARSSYYAAFYLLWSALMAVALINNLGVAWVLIEVTTAASAVLVAFGGLGKPLEAGWKYLALSTLGLSVTLLGIIVLYAGIGGGASSLSTLNWETLIRLAAQVDHTTALLAFVLILAGLAAKIGWAPVHSWGIDAHSEAPSPIAALLSAALSPTVILIAWRVQVALQPTLGGSASGLFLAFGLLSVALAIPFLWRDLPLKRLFAYSSLEHMGILALGIGFSTPLATAGVVLHLAGHALAKSLAFYATIPLLRADPRLSTRAPRGLAARSPVAAAAIGVSLLALSGLPPSPLFFSELLILLGGIAAGETVVVVVAAVLLALGFLGLMHALIEGTLTDKQARPRRRIATGPRFLLLTIVVAIGLLALSATAFLLPDSLLVQTLMGGLL